jgi:hypothetical protein
MTTCIILWLRYEQRRINISILFQIKPNLLRPLSVGDSHIISVPNTGQEFTVTMIDANHCPGSVMFLFQGE